MNTPWWGALAHTLGGTSGDPLGVTGAAVAALGATLPALALGLWLARWAPAAGRDDPLVRGAAGGMLLWLFLDLSALAANLGMGLANPPVQVGLLAAFLAGVLAPARWAGAAPAWGWAAGVGLHGLGEGLVMGYQLAHGLASALRPLPLASFVLHKVAEGWTVGLLAGGRPGPLLALAALPGVAGAVAGALEVRGLWGNFIYAAGAGVLAWTLTHFLASGGRRHAAGLAVGVAMLYLVGWLHEF